MKIIRFQYFFLKRNRSWIRTYSKGQRVQLSGHRESKWIKNKRCSLYFRLEEWPIWQPVSHHTHTHSIYTPPASSEIKDLSHTHIYTHTDISLSTRAYCNPGHRVDNRSESSGLKGNNQTQRDRLETLISLFKVSSAFFKQDPQTIELIELSVACALKCEDIRTRWCFGNINGWKYVFHKYLWFQSKLNLHDPHSTALLFHYYCVIL